MSSSINKGQYSEVQKLAIMLPTYLQYSNFLEQKVPTHWSTLESYKGKTEKNPFEVEYVSGIAQQACDSLDCGVFIAVFAEFLSDGLQVPCSGIVADYHRLRYASLLCNYGLVKAVNGYASDNEDPPRPKPNFIPPDVQDVVTIE